MQDCVPVWRLTTRRVANGADRSCFRCLRLLTSKFINSLDTLMSATSEGRNDS